MKTKILTGLFALIVSSAFSQSEVSMLNYLLESRTNKEILPIEGFQHGKCYNERVGNIIIHSDESSIVFPIYQEQTSKSLMHVNHFTTAKFNGNGIELTKYSKYQYIKDGVLGFIPNPKNTLIPGFGYKNVLVAEVENVNGLDEGLRICKIVISNENTDGSKILWLIGGAIKYSQYNVIKGSFSWDNGLNRFFNQNIATLK